MYGIWCDRTHHCWQIAPQENFLKHRLHRWWIETVVVLVLFSFTFTLNRTTNYSISSHMLQDLSLPAWYQLTSKLQVRSQRCLWQKCPGSPALSCTEKIWESWDPGVAWSSQPPGMKLVLNQCIQMRTITAPAHPRSPEMTNPLNVPCRASHQEWVRFSGNSAFH